MAATKRTRSKPEMADTPKVVVKGERKPDVRAARGAAPTSDGAFTEWVRDHPRRIREAEQKGYRMAQESDVAEGHDGYKGAGGEIRNGDLVLMVGSRERKEAELRERAERAQEREYAGARGIESGDPDVRGAIETDRSRHGKTVGGKFYSIP